jgi:hypothetical protein
MLGLLAALRWLRYAMTFCSPVLPARGKILKKGISPLALNQISFVECPRFMSFAAGRGEAGSVKGGRTVPVYGASANTLDGFRPALP